MVQVSTIARLPVAWLQATLGSLTRMTLPLCEVVWPVLDGLPEPLEEPVPLDGAALEELEDEPSGWITLVTSPVVSSRMTAGACPNFWLKSNAFSRLPAAESADPLPIRPRLQLSSMKRRTGSARGWPPAPDAQRVRSVAVDKSAR